MILFDDCDIFFELFDLWSKWFLSSQTAVSPLVHLALIVVIIHEIVFAILLKSGVHLIAFKLGNALIISLVSLLVRLVLLYELLFDAVLENVIDGIHCAVYCFLHEIRWVILIFDVLKNFEALTSPLLITFKRLLNKWVIVEECLLEVLYRREV